MSMLMRVCLIAMLLLCYVQLRSAAETREIEEFSSSDKNTDGNIGSRGNYTPSNDWRPEPANPRKKMRKPGGKRVPTRPQGDVSCARLGGICQPRRSVCPGRYLKGKCSEGRTQECCVQARAWSVLCAGHRNNRVRACDAHGCGAFNSKSLHGCHSSYRDNRPHKAVDLVCDDYHAINAPFSGSLEGPVSRKDQAGHQYDGVKLVSEVYCVKIFNVRPYRYFGPVAQGEALGYLLPLQDCFPGITSHVELQMCDGTDPSSLI